jgi:transcription-repair coupling factor (superfamily II helicase)
MKEKKTRAGLRLLLTFEKISSIERALKVLEPLDFRVKVEEEAKV